MDGFYTLFDFGNGATSDNVILANGNTLFAKVYVGGTSIVQVGGCSGWGEINDSRNGKDASMEGGRRLVQTVFGALG